MTQTRLGYFMCSKDLWGGRACLVGAGHSQAATAWLKPSLESDKGTDQVCQACRAPAVLSKVQHRLPADTRLAQPEKCDLCRGNLLSMPMQPVPGSCSTSCLASLQPPQWHLALRWMP